MPVKKDIDLKQYFSISEVAERFGVTVTLLRYWEKQFPTIIKPRKGGRGVRFYTQKDIDDIALVFHLVKENGMTLEGARKVIVQQRGVVEKNKEIVDHLKSIRNELQSISKALGELQ